MSLTPEPAHRRGYLTEVLVDRHGAAIVLGRFVTVLRTYVGSISRQSAMRWRRLVTLDAIGFNLRDSLVGRAVAALGSAAGTLLDIVSAGVLVALVGIFVADHRRRRGAGPGLGHHTTSDQGATV